jgi:ribosomal protein L7/L12
MTVKPESIVAIFNSYGVNMRLTDAFGIANEAINLMRPALTEEYKRGEAAGEKKQQYAIEDKAYADGYKNGKAEGERRAENSDERYELARLRNLEKQMLIMANGMVREIIERVGRDKKIACIKELRVKTMIGLKDAKDIVDKHCKIIDEEKKAWEAKENSSSDGFTESE